MSYLDVPRIQFGGLFFTNPDTINNYIRSYNPGVPLTDAQGQYLASGPGGSPSGWNAVGVAQLWLEQCRVLSAVDPSGRLLSDPAADPVVGAAVESPSPSTPKQTPDGKGFYDIAKMVDLDPYQQGRSAVYGLRIYVTLPGGGGFSGLMTVPELQFLGGRVPVQTGSWAAVGTWMGQIAEVAWEGDVAASPFLARFREACGRGVAVKLTVDLHQNNNATRLTPGNMFCYGRVLGSMGPVAPAGGVELPQVVPGRQIVPPPAAPQAAAEALAAASLGGGDGEEGALAFTLRTLDDRFRSAPRPGAAAEAPEAESQGGAASLDAATATTPPLPWNTAFAQVSQAGGNALLHVDLGGSIQLQGSLQNGVGVSNGKFVVDTGISIGVATAGGVQPLARGEVSFAGQYQLLDSQSKTVNLVASSGLVDVPLETDEVALVQANPLVVSVGSTVVLQEPASGLLLGTDPLSVRLQPGGTAALRMMARRFGSPVVGQQPMTWQVFVVTATSLQPSTVITIAWNGSTDASGIAALSVSTGGGDVTLPAARQPLDSQIYYVYFLDPTGQLVGDGYGQQVGDANASLSALRFQSYTAPADPTWQADVGPVLGAYARLYPGMRDRLDIGDQGTVQGFATALYQRMSLPFQDPAYMPVTRDLSPAKVEMILQWLKAYVPPPPQGP